VTVKEKKKKKKPGRMAEVFRLGFMKLIEKKSKGQIKD
jgi:hypothetical protein